MKLILKSNDSVQSQASLHRVGRGKKGKSNLCMTSQLFPKSPELLALNSQVRKV